MSDHAPGEGGKQCGVGGAHWKPQALTVVLVLPAPSVGIDTIFGALDLLELAVILFVLQCAVAAFSAGNPIAYRSGRSRHWVKSKNPDAPAVRREAEEDWGK